MSGHVGLDQGNIQSLGISIHVCPALLAEHRCQRVAEGLCVSRVGASSPLVLLVVNKQILLLTQVHRFLCCFYRSKFSPESILRSIFISEALKSIAF